MTQVKQTEPLVFRCDWSGRIATDIALLALLFFLGMDIYVYSSYDGPDVTKCRTWFPVLTVLGFNNFNIWKCGGDVHVDATGVGRWRLGRRWQFIAWKDVKVATLESFLENRQDRTMATIFKTETVRWIDAQFAGMRFGTDFLNGEQLVEAVLQRLREHNVRIIDRRKP